MSGIWVVIVVAVTFAVTLRLTHLKRISYTQLMEAPPLAGLWMLPFVEGASTVIFADARSIVVYVLAIPLSIRTVKKIQVLLS